MHTNINISIQIYACSTFLFTESQWCFYITQETLCVGRNNPYLVYISNRYSFCLFPYSLILSKPNVTQLNSTKLKSTIKQLALDLDIVATCSTTIPTHPTTTTSKDHIEQFKVLLKADHSLVVIDFNE